MRDLKGMSSLPCRNAFLVPAIVLCILLSGRQPAYCQAQGRGQYDSIRTGAIVLGPDTLAFYYLDNVDVIDRLPKRLAKRREEWNRLKYNVWKVYPYAVAAADILKGVDEELARRDGDKKARKAYLASLEKRLNDKFKGELENLSINQGQILVKLISRQTGRNCYGLIRELKSGFSAVVWQSVAMLFSNNLKREYDPVDRDRDIERIVAELEQTHYYQYQQQRQDLLRRQGLSGKR